MSSGTISSFPLPPLIIPVFCLVFRPFRPDANYLRWFQGIPGVIFACGPGTVARSYLSLRAQIRRTLKTGWTSSTRHPTAPWIDPCAYRPTQCPRWAASPPRPARTSPPTLSRHKERMSAGSGRLVHTRHTRICSREAVPGALRLRGRVRCFDENPLVRLSSPVRIPAPIPTFHARVVHGAYASPGLLAPSCRLNLCALNLPPEAFLDDSASSTTGRGSPYSLCTAGMVWTSYSVYLCRVHLAVAS